MPINSPLFSVKCPVLVLTVAILLLSGCGHKPTPVKGKADNKVPARLVNKNIKDMNLEEIYQAIAFYRQQKNLPGLGNALERAIILEKNPEKIEPLLFELARAKEDIGLWEEAEAFYENFLQLYPGSNSADEVTYRLINTINQQNRGAERDQTKTKKIKEKVQVFLKRFPKSSYRELVQEFLNSASNQTLEHEVGRAFFYIQKYTYSNNATALEAARSRIIGLTENLKKTISELPKNLEADLDSVGKTDFKKKSLDTQYLELYRIADDIMRLLYERKIKR